MKTSTHAIQTTHVGSLPRPDDLIALAARRQAGEIVDPALYEARLAEAVAEVTRLQQHAGISIPGDGEFGKEMGQRVNYGAWWGGRTSSPPPIAIPAAAFTPTSPRQN